MALPRLAWLAALAAGLVLGVSVPDAHAGPTEVGAPVEHRLAVAYEPTSGELDLAVEIFAPPEDYVFNLKPAGWLTVENLEVGRLPLEGADLEGEIELGWESHLGRHIRVELSGRVPEQSEEQQTTARTPDALYLFADDGWLPEAHPARNRYWIELSVPEPFHAVAPGNLVLEGRDGTSSRSVYDLLTVGEGPSIFAGEYTVTERIESGRRLRTYFFDDDPQLSEAYLNAAETYIDRYSALIGDYPYTGFSIVAGPLSVGLGFSGMTYVSRDILQHPYMRGRSLAHEVLHNWWGNAVSVDYEAGNWGEGLTTYLADHSLAEEEAPATAREIRLDWLRQLAALPEDDRHSIRSFRSASHDRSQAVGYGKSALMFHMLREEVGGEAFTDGLRAFYAGNRHARANWDDLRMAFEDASARDLRWFFDQWLDEPDMPTVELRRASIEAFEGEHLIRLDLSQDRAESRVSLPALIETDDAVIRKIIPLSGGDETVEILVQAKPNAITLDPEFEVIRRLKPEEVPPTIGSVMQPPTSVLLLLGDGNGDDVLPHIEALLRGRPDVTQDIADLRLVEAAIVVGSTTRVAEALSDILKGAKPSLDPLAGTSRAWSQRMGSGGTVLFVSADEEAGLSDLLTALRYYRNKSFVIREEGRATDSGVLLAERGPLVLRIE